ncbi:MAG: helix-turn-helix domain-containing protein [Candidatus Bipolaricaulaceae bacterium]
METYLATGSIAETARRWHTSRNVVRKWVQRYHEEGLPGLSDRSHRPRCSPSQTPAEIEAMVVEAKRATGYGRKRLAWYLWREKGLVVSPHTIRHIPRRHGFTGRKKRRQTFYPAHWAWEEERPFAPLPVDVSGRKDEAQVLGLELRDQPHQRVVLHGTGDAVVKGARDRGGGGVADGLGGRVWGQ